MKFFKKFGFLLEDKRPKFYPWMRETFSFNYARLSGIFCHAAQGIGRAQIFNELWNLITCLLEKVGTYLLCQQLKTK